ncbi:hypothetical protein Glove_490g40 [Diversispora epigaea]|uniref:DNA-directed RNA polymerase subunit beta n=1 Tax=Diversispora epigaea TaxID=1348612 RepID=A0A397GS05_9GLOM|nr:hypothetical protein Glove_490g40 [Diversispora epigaea]
MNFASFDSDSFMLSPENDFYENEYEASSFDSEILTDDDENTDQYYENDDDEDKVDISQDECWKVISSFFEKRGIVRQQLDSYDEFIQNGLQDIIEQNKEVVLMHAEGVDNKGRRICKRLRVEFDVLLFSRPTITESDGSVIRLYPQEARLRNLTYASPLFIKSRLGTAIACEDDPNFNAICDEREKFTPWQNILIGKIPVMVRSSYCSLYYLNEEQLTEFNECPYDQGGYFIINGSEKVLIAQERLANNVIFVFKKQPSSPYAYSAEIRSSGEKGLAIRTFTLKLLSKSGDLDDSERYIHATVPFLKKDIPVKILFVALGISNEQDILQLIGALSDEEFTEVVKPCLGEGFIIQTKRMALDYIGRRAASPGIPQEKRIALAKRILEKEFIPHLGETFEFEKQKAYFLGYMIRQLLLCALERRPLDDRDHFGKKRLDLADYIGRRAASPGIPQEKRIALAKRILEKEFIPHLGETFEFEKQKAYFLGYMIRQLLLCALERRPLDDRDHFGKKRLDLAGALLSNLFNNLFKKMVKDMTILMKKMLAEKREINLEMIIKSQTITNGMRYSLGTGNWGDAKRAMQSKSGVAQVLNRFTYASTLSHLRRCNAPVSRGGKVTRPRYLHNTHWGYVCPAETPEGQACGLMKNLSLMAYISVGSLNSLIIEHIHATGLLDSQINIHPDIHLATKVLVNGSWIGITHNDELLYNTLKELKKCGDFNHDVSIVNDIRSKEIRIYSDPGRVCRPLFVVRDSRLKIKRILKKPHNKKRNNFDWENLIYNGFIEYLDAEEEEFALICMTPEELKDSRVGFAYESMRIGPPTRPHSWIDRAKKPTVYTNRWTHCEIHPSMILGVTASLIPFPDHNQSPRNTYQAAMGKQAMGMYATNFQSRMDVVAHILYYPQKPLVTTKVMEYLKFRELPAGHNAIVAILCYEGYNQEDSIIMNQDSVDRGMFRSFIFRNYQENEKRKGVVSYDEIMKPTYSDTVGLRFGSAEKLDDDGVVSPGMPVTEGDILIGKTTILTPEDAMLGQRGTYQKYRNLSTILRRSEAGFVDHVVITSDQDALKSAKVRVRNTRIPEMGDKFASRHGQKGTIGILYRQEDMPFTCEGIIPDIIINPHAIPSRMTVGHLIECLLGKLVVLTGNEGDSTPFTDVTVDSISSKLKELGHNPYGNEIMYNGYTGKKLEARVFIGPTYYQRLKHMVHDKIHSRARGPLNILTRQPVEGRNRDGGLRFGEMERDCMISHGTALFLKERLFDVSDPFYMHVCDLCGLMALANISKGIYECRICKNSVRVSLVQIPYACKMLFQELMSMNISPRLYLET